MKCQKLSSRGFSLVELMIVIAAVAILAAVAIPAYHNHIMRSRQADAYHNLLDIKAAQEMFYSMNNTYAGPYTLSAEDTFTKMLSFQYSDTTYYVYQITAASGTAFTAKAVGKYKKLLNNIIRIRDDEDPCMEAAGDLKQSLGLDNCP